MTLSRKSVAIAKRVLDWLIFHARSADYRVTGGRPAAVTFFEACEGKPAQGRQRNAPGSRPRAGSPLTREGDTR